MLAEESKDDSRSPSGMTTRKTKATTKADPFGDDNKKDKGRVFFSLRAAR
jgi:hypothetical protein